MIGLVALAAALVIVAAIAFVASVRLGILVGRRLDGAMEAHASSGDEESTRTRQSSGDGRSGREEHR
jgi:hypothetical protein